MKTYGNLIRLFDLDDDFIVDLIYSTKENFTGEVVYNFTECYIDKDTAKRLINARNLAKKDGYRMKIWDAYRPVSAQERFWELLPDNNFVAYPPDMEHMTEFKNSHMNGQCVDVTLTDMNGNDIEMPSGFDEFSDKARLDCCKEGTVARKNGEYLKDIMMQSGFSPYDGEWWHFYDRNVTPCRYSDIHPL